MRKKIFSNSFLSLSAIFIISLTAVSTAAEIKGFVSANKLNVRVKPGAFTVVASLKEGAQVTIHRQKGDWLEISTPADSKAFVASSFIKDGVIQKEVNLRSGPGVAYKPYGTLKAGVKVKVINASRTDWIQVEPPEGTKAWVSSRYVSVAPEDLLKLEPGMATAEEKKEADKKKSEKEKASAEKAKADKEKAAAKADALPFIKGDEKIVTISGVLLPLNKDAVYVTHALATKISDKYFPICYIHTDKDLKLWINRKVNIRGKQRWVKGWKRPVVEVETITPVW